MWRSWFTAWWAANWTPDDLPVLRFVIRLYDRVGRGDIRRAAELRQWLDSYGITPKGQQDRRWTRPLPPRQGWTRRGAGRYDHLRGEPRLGTRERLQQDDPDTGGRFRTIQRRDPRLILDPDPH